MTRHNCKQLRDGTRQIKADFLESLMEDISSTYLIKLGHSLLNEEAYWWSASPDIYAGSALRAMALCMQKPEYLIQPASFKQTGYSVRCIKDTEYTAFQFEATGVKVDNDLTP